MPDHQSNWNSSKPLTLTKLESYAIYEEPLDYPGKFVVRRWTVVPPAGDGKTKLLQDDAPTAICLTLAQARQAIPNGLTPIKKLPGDDPHLVEVWI